jgi:signal transduction histidine kinase
VWNLLTNAIKFTPRGGTITLTCAGDGANAVVRVADTGEGIEPDLLPFVFDRFRQGDASATRPHGGLGLGLSIVRHLVELHGGEVHATSDGAGHGATFIVQFPVVADSD